MKTACKMIDVTLINDKTHRAGSWFTYTLIGNFPDSPGKYSMENLQYEVEIVKTIKAAFALIEQPSPLLCNIAPNLEQLESEK